MPATEMRVTLPGVTDPFPGLRPFESDEEPIFRGRRQHTDELLRRLASHRFLAVVGTSGSGKSSLVRAGLLPALDRGYLAGATSRWRIAVMRPGMAPIDNLAAALGDKEALPAADAAKLRSSSLGLVETVRDASLTAGESLLVVADQFEELFRYQRRTIETDGGAEAAMFVNLLLTAVKRPDVPIYVVLTMRSDFLGDCAQFPGLPEALSESQYLIPRLTREQRRLAIEEPLRLFRATMTPQLVEQLLNDSGDEVSGAPAISHYRGAAPDPLPVLQHALMRTYLEWKSLPGDGAGGRIDLEHYDKAGRMETALDKHAESVFTKELDDAGRKWAERIFRCVTTTELGRPIRRPTPLADLYKVVGARDEDRPKIDAVLAVYRRRENSFLQVNKDTSVDISHESLIWKWKRLSGWVAQEAAGAELYRDLVKDARGKATWGEPKLSAALAIRGRDAWNEDWAHQYSESRFEDVEAFLARSRTAVRNQQLIRWFGLAAAVALVILGVVAYYSRQKLAAALVLREGDAMQLERLKLNQDDLSSRIAGLDSSQGKTQADRDRIAKEKSDLEAQLNKSQSDSQKLTAQAAQQSTDLAASVKSLQTRLDQAQKDRDDEAKKRQDAESKLAQLEARVNAPPSVPDKAPVPVAPKAETPLKDNPVPAPNPSVLPPASVQPIRVLFGGMVVSLAWSPDGKNLASANAAEDVQIWDAASGRSLRTLQGHQSYVFRVAWSPDAMRLPTAIEDKRVRKWHPASGQLIRTLQGHSDAVHGVAWSPDGKTLASASYDKTIRLWDAASGRLLRILQGHQGAVWSVAWSPGGKTLASGSDDNTVRLWDAASGKTRRTLDQQAPVKSVAWSPDGKRLASANDDNIRLWVVASGQLLRTLPGQVESVAWSRDEKTLASANTDATVRLWDAASGQSLGTLHHSGTVFTVEWSPNGKTLASGSFDGTIRLWDTSRVRD